MGEDKDWWLPAIILFFSILGSGFGLWIKKSEVSGVANKCIYYALGAVVACVTTPVVMNIWSTDPSLIGFIAFILGSVGASLLIELAKSVPDIVKIIIDAIKFMVQKWLNK